MINWRLAEDVVCPVDDMKKSDCSRPSFQRGIGGGGEGRETRVLGVGVWRPE